MFNLINTVSNKFVRQYLGLQHVQDFSSLQQFSVAVETADGQYNLYTSYVDTNSKMTYVEYS